MEGWRKGEKEGGGGRTSNHKGEACHQMEGEGESQVSGRCCWLHI